MSVVNGYKLAEGGLKQNQVKREVTFTVLNSNKRRGKQ